MRRSFVLSSAVIALASLPASLTVPLLTGNSPAHPLDPEDIFLGGLPYFFDVVRTDFLFELGADLTLIPS